jgi:hypothetical protein
VTVARKDQLLIFAMTIISVDCLCRNTNNCWPSLTQHNDIHIKCACDCDEITFVSFNVNVIDDVYNHRLIFIDQYDEKYKMKEKDVNKVAVIYAYIGWNYNILDLLKNLYVNEDFKYVFLWKIMQNNYHLQIYFQSKIQSPLIYCQMWLR